MPGWYGTVRCGVAAATVIRRHYQRRNKNGYATKPQGGDTRSRRIEAYRETVLALHEAWRDIPLDELRSELCQAGVTVISSLHYFFSRHSITRKKIRHAVEQDRAEVLSARGNWFDGQIDLDPERLVFLAETWAAINMARSQAAATGTNGCGWVTRTVIARRPPWSRACA